ncbi:MAG TPA: tetratricopeptide repeat protein [Burkholderiales bacterium]|nr:tetratricopeptide repeat protein [Burkholderiales bacterium]
MNLEAGWQALERDDFAAAERAARAVLVERAEDAEALYLLGSTWLFAGRAREALQPLSAAARRDSRRGILYRLGHCYLALGQPEAAADALRREVAAHPESAPAHNTLGVALVQQRHHEAALAEFLAALAIDERHAEANNNAANALAALGRADEAVSYLQRAVEINPGLPDAHHNLGLLLQSLRRHEEAIPSFARAVELAPRTPYALSSLVTSEIAVCRWQEAAPHIVALRAQVREGVVPAVPFTVLAVSPSAEEQLRCAETFTRDTIGSRSAPPRPLRPKRDRIRLAYLSSDFQEHATAWLAARLFELHDRKDFEVIGISYGEDDGTAMRRRLASAFDRFVDVARESDAKASDHLRLMDVDIAVDLKGHTRGARLGILAARPAPLQVTYLGYPGTLAASFIDYAIADDVLIPPHDERFYTEALARLPNCYQVNDATRPIGKRAPTRAEAGLPADAFVFCCFNNNFKITPQVFDAWMRLLHAVPASVLWLLEDTSAASRNLRQHAVERGVDPARLVFAPRQRQEEHLARHALADLFLDTLPCNAHTTASDALWTGLPLVTCLGTTFAGRVAASLLHGVGLPELVTHNLADYEAHALRLARDKPALAALRAKLSANRLTHPLFDTDRFRRHIEMAYRHMVERHARGEAPQSFRVPPAG